MGANPLKIQKDILLESLNNIDCGDYDKQYARRCIAVSRKNIIRLEGLVWKNH